MQAGDSNIPVPLDSLAGTPNYIDTLTGATVTLIVTATTKSPAGAFSRVVVPSDRLTINGDGRTLIWTKMASDTPYGSVYDLQLIALLPNGETRPSTVTSISVQADI